MSVQGRAVRGAGALGAPPPAPPPERLENADRLEVNALREAHERLREQIATLEDRLRQRDLQRRAMLHIMADLHDLNRRLSKQRRAMLHILVDYESDRRRLAAQSEGLANTRRALIHLLQDTHQTNLRLETSRKAMIHIMGDLHEATLDLQGREKELREKQEQLVQAGKMATLGELTTGVAHELNNPLNNIALYIANVVDRLDLGEFDPARARRDLTAALQQVPKATEIISHLRTFGRSAPMSREPIPINEIVHRALSLTHEQLRLRQIAVHLDLDASEPWVMGNAIQLEQVFINLLTNARDALSEAARKEIHIASAVRGEMVEIVVRDTGHGIPPGLEQRIFDPFFTTKEVGRGTGLGLSITYGIVKDHQGTISVLRETPGEGAAFSISLPLARPGMPPQAGAP